MLFGIESSCDESSIALFCENRGVVYERTYTQSHVAYGGVVPALATKKHLEQLPILLEEVREHFSYEHIKKIAVTYGPGLGGCLAMGLSMAKAMALYLNIPFVGVNHLFGHAFSPFISLHEEDPKNFFSNIKPFLPHCGLLVSGGNTLLFEVREDLTLHSLGCTLDDAAGEAFDKGAKLLGFPYPGGAYIEKYAQKGNPQACPFPVPYKNKKELMFSFSGLKTALRYFLEKITDTQLNQQLSDICASYQAAIVESLRIKVKHALQASPYKSLGLSGGVANNKALRSEFSNLGLSLNMPVFIAKPHYCGDNAAMIAFAAYIKSGCLSDDYSLCFNSSLSI